ncbi:MAG: putative DNA modification/repair radical SAM protein [Spirochaetales bacterium]|nr:putative DNA modification/repair radical SAM protein [Spirochaetales bacterium]
MNMTTSSKLCILGSSAKYDVSCVSSGINRKGNGIGSTTAGGICHTWTGDGRCISLLKVLFSNVCVYDCAYCINRSSNDIERASFTVEELVSLTLNFYRRNYIEGLFLSSGVIGSPDATMLKLIETARILREREGFLGYIHIKTVPGTSDDLIAIAGFYADRLSVNTELPSEESLKKLAPQKTKSAIFNTMGSIHSGIARYLDEKDRFASVPNFAPAGQSTQVIVGAAPDPDRQILVLADSLYRKFRLRRVYYSAYIPVNNDSRLPAPSASPLRREHRLYQADWLLRFYQFEINELVDNDNPDLDPDIDPKLAWALRHMEFFPVDLATADLHAILRIPGIGNQSATKIINARKTHCIDFDTLVRMRIVMKRARYFLTINGKFYGDRAGSPTKIRTALLQEQSRQLWLFA